MKKFWYLDIIEEIEAKGFVETPNNSSYVLIKLRERLGENLKIFNAGFNISVGRTGARYGTYDIFGDRICYYYDIRRDKEFVDFLIKKFFDKNPDPDKEIRKIFTRILHYYRLHWFGCCHSGKSRYGKNVEKLKE